MTKPIRKATRKKKLLVRTERDARIDDAIARLKALQESGVGRAFDPADIDPIIALLVSMGK